MSNKLKENSNFETNFWQNVGNKMEFLFSSLASDKEEEDDKEEEEEEDLETSQRN